MDGSVVARVLAADAIGCPTGSSNPGGDVFFSNGCTDTTRRREGACLTRRCPRPSPPSSFLKRASYGLEWTPRISSGDPGTVVLAGGATRPGIIPLTGECVAYGGFYGAVANAYVTASHVLGLARLATMMATDGDAEPPVVRGAAEKTKTKTKTTRRDTNAEILEGRAKIFARTNRHVEQTREE